eukprot:Gb_34365 [translate_table: standard]
MLPPDGTKTLASEAHLFGNSSILIFKPNHEKLNITTIRSNTGHTIYRSWFKEIKILTDVLYTLISEWGVCTIYYGILPAGEVITKKRSHRRYSPSQNSVKRLEAINAIKTIGKTSCPQRTKKDWMTKEESKPTFQAINQMNKWKKKRENKASCSADSFAYTQLIKVASRNKLSKGGSRRFIEYVDSAGTSIQPNRGNGSTGGVAALCNDKHA